MTRWGNWRKPYHQKAKTISALGENHIDVATSYSNLACVCRSLRRLEEAEKLNRKALSIADSVLGENHINTATIYTRLEEAAEYYWKDLKVKHFLLGESHIEVENLSSVYESMERFEEAVDFFQKALNIDLPLLERITWMSSSRCAPLDMDSAEVYILAYRPTTQSGGFHVDCTNSVFFALNNSFVPHYS